MLLDAKKEKFKYDNTSTIKATTSMFTFAGGPDPGSIFFDWKFSDLISFKQIILQLR